VDGSGDARRRVHLRDASDLVVARTAVREIGVTAGLSPRAIEALATAVTEIARNVVIHAGNGDVRVELGSFGARRGVVATIRDDGPGIADIDRAMRDGFSTGTGLGLGLPAARRLVDEFELVSMIEVGTTVTLRKFAT